jgi:hypothetical protein
MGVSMLSPNGTGAAGTKYGQPVPGCRTTASANETIERRTRSVYITDEALAVAGRQFSAV